MKYILRKISDWRFKRGIRKLSDSHLEIARQISSKCEETYFNGKELSKSGGVGNMREGIFMMGQSMRSLQRLQSEITRGKFTGDWEFNPRSLKDIPE